MKQSAMFTLYAVMGLVVEAFFLFEFDNKIAGLCFGFITIISAGMADYLKSKGL